MSLNTNNNQIIISVTNKKKENVENMLILGGRLYYDKSGKGS